MLFMELILMVCLRQIMACNIGTSVSARVKLSFSFLNALVVYSFGSSRVVNVCYDVGCVALFCFVCHLDGLSSCRVDLSYGLRVSPAMRVAITRACVHACIRACVHSCKHT